MKRRRTIIICLAFLLAGVSCQRKEPVFGYREIDGKLSEAAGTGNLAQMKTLVAQGADVNKTCCGRVPALHAAAYDGHNEAIKYLLAQGARVDIGGKFNETALMAAVEDGHLETVKLLVTSGANVNAYDTMNFSTPLKIAKARGHQDVASYLVSQGAKESIWWHRFITW